MSSGMDGPRGQQLRGLLTSCGEIVEKTQRLFDETYKLELNTYCQCLSEFQNNDSYINQLGTLLPPPSPLSLSRQNFEFSLHTEIRRHAEWRLAISFVPLTAALTRRYDSMERYATRIRFSVETVPLTEPLKEKHNARNT